MVYIYGKLKDVKGTECSPVFKTVINNATLVYTDCPTITKNYKSVGVEVKPLTVKKKTTPKK